MPKVAPNVNKDAAKFYRNHFKNFHAGATQVLDWFPEIFKATLTDMRGLFADGELRFMLKACKYNDGYSGRNLIMCCENAIDDWDPMELEIDGEHVVNQLKMSRSPFEKMCLEVFFTAFWRNPRHNKSQKEWIERLQ